MQSPKQDCSMTRAKQLTKALEAAPSNCLVFAAKTAYHHNSLRVPFCLKFFGEVPLQGSLKIQDTLSCCSALRIIMSQEQKCFCQFKRCL